MGQLMEPLRDDVGKVTDPKAPSLGETPVEVLTEVRREEALLKTGALQSAIFNSANFSSIATDAKGVIQIFNVGAERMLGYAAADVMNKITPADISDPREVIARAKALSVELSTPITPGFEALVFKAKGPCLKATKPTTTPKKCAPKRAVEQCSNHSYEKTNDRNIEIPCHRAGQSRCLQSQPDRSQSGPAGDHRARWQDHGCQRRDGDRHGPHA